MKRPNVITIMTDQQRFDSLSCLGNRVIETPHLDKLAAEGTLFTQATCASPLCGPSRACMLSGTYNHGHGFGRNAEIGQPGMDESVVTVDEILTDHGYHAAYCGKWHTGDANRSCYRGGLDDYLKGYNAFLESRYPGRRPRGNEKIDRYTMWPYRPWAVDDMMLAAGEAGYSMPHHNEAGVMDIRPEESLTAWTASQAVAFLQDPPSEPFALTCSILHPHAPLIAVEPYGSMYEPGQMPLPGNIDDDCGSVRQRPVPEALLTSPEGLGEFMALYFALVKEVDDWVGRILHALAASGLADNTLVIFTSDHGELMGSHGTVSKMNMFEESIRVPLIMWMPGTVKQQTVEKPATGADLLPTILDCTGIAIPGHVHGTSLWGTATGTRSADREYAYCELGRQRALRSGHWKLVLNPAAQGNIANPVLLYNLRADPGEQTNLAPEENRSTENLRTLADLRSKLLALMIGMGVPETTVDEYRGDL